MSILKQLGGQYFAPVTFALDSSLVVVARTHGLAANRSEPKQIEHWAIIGRIAEQNTHLPNDSIGGLLRAKAEIEAGNASQFSFE